MICDYVLNVEIFDRYELWLRGADVGPHPEDPRQTAAPPPTPMDLHCIQESQSGDGDIVPKNKRHTIHRKKNVVDSAEGINTDIPPDVKKVLQEMEEEHLDDQPDEQQLEVLEDIWLKAGEMGKKLDLSSIDRFRNNDTTNSLIPLLFQNWQKQTSMMMGIIRKKIESESEKYKKIPTKGN